MSVEIKQVSEREIWVGECKVKLGEDGILYLSSVGDIDEEVVLAFKEAVLNLTKMVEGNVNAIADLTRAGKPSSKARRLSKEFFESGPFGKIASYGMHPVARVIASFVMTITNKKDMRFFNTREEALEWMNR